VRRQTIILGKVFKVRFVFPTNGDDTVIGLVGLIARRLPPVLQATAGATTFRPWSHAVLTLRIFAEDASDAVLKAAEKTRLAFELSSKAMPTDFSVEASPVEEEETDTEH
jgi:hypothetical protein